MNKLSTKAEKILYVFLRESYVRSFGRYFVPSITSVDSTQVPKKVCFDFTVPPSMCRDYPSFAKTDEKPQSTTGAMLALFDELSSQAMMVKDSTHRPGVSIHLDTQLLKPVYSGDELHIVTKADKLGKSIGFSSVEFYRVNNGSNDERSLVAQGKHIKFMPAGIVWDIVAGKYLGGLCLNLYDMFRAKKFKTPIDELFKTWQIPLIERSKEDSTISYLFDSLGVEHVTKTEDGYDEYKVTVKKTMTNMMNMMHGGALASSIDQALYLYRKDSIEKNKLFIQIDDIDIRYLTSMKGQIFIQVADDDDSPYFPNSSLHTKSIGKVLNSKHQLCAEFTAHWRVF